MMRILISRWLLVVLMAVSSTAWAQTYSGVGTVQSIRESHEGSTTGNVVGAVGGALLGGWLGSNIGGGTGRTIATGVGAVGGAMAGRSAGNKMSSATVWYVTVRFDDGIDREIRVDQSPSYRPGDRVRVSDNVIQRITR
jgi:outer membrane lipoprotein SlyB